MIKTAPHSTLSPQMWCIKKIKDWFALSQIYWQEFVNLSNAKNYIYIYKKCLFSVAVRLSLSCVLRLV